MFLVSCGNQKDTLPEDTKLEALKAKYEEKIDLYHSLTNQVTANWPTDHDCDAAISSSTTYYLKTRLTYSAATPQYGCSLTGVRIA